MLEIDKLLRVERRLQLKSESMVMAAGHAEAANPPLETEDGECILLPLVLPELDLDIFDLIPGYLIR